MAFGAISDSVADARRISIPLTGHCCRFAGMMRFLQNDPACMAHEASHSRKHFLATAFAACLLAAAQSIANASTQLSARARTLPPPGTTWCYSTGKGQTFPMTLKGSSAGVASYDIGVGHGASAIEEQSDTYTPTNGTRQGSRRLIVFPIVKDKTWSDEFSEVLTARLGHDIQWQYTYQARSLSRVIGSEKRGVGAGTFDTFIIERKTAWTKRSPHSDSSELREQHCDTDDCSVDGYSKEVLWYAPSVGRGVLRAYAQSGDKSVWDYSPDDLIRNASSLVTELVGYGNDAACASAQPPLLGSIPTAPWYGFPLLMNDTWEFLMQRDIARE
ncbi:hypothetical protein AB6809_28165 [Paraburkholderia sp. RCC_158]